LNDLYDIPTEVYNASIETFKKKKTNIENELRNLSNLEKCIDNVLLIFSNLSDLWKDSSFDTQQKIQNLLFPSRVKYNKQENSYLTIKENNVFSVLFKLLMNYKNAETKKNRSSAILSI